MRVLVLLFCVCVLGGGKALSREISSKKRVLIPLPRPSLYRQNYTRWISYQTRVQRSRSA